MQRVIVTVQLARSEYGLDLELPADIPVRELVGLILQAVGANSALETEAYQIEAYPPGRILDPAETLAASAVWDGAWLLVLVKDFHGPEQSVVEIISED